MDLYASCDGDCFAPIKNAEAGTDWLKLAISIELVGSLQEGDFDAFRKAIKAMIEVCGEPLYVLFWITVVKGL